MPTGLLRRPRGNARAANPNQLCPYFPTSTRSSRSEPLSRAGAAFSTTIAPAARATPVAATVTAWGISICSTSKRAPPRALPNRYYSAQLDGEIAAGYDHRAVVSLAVDGRDAHAGTDDGVGFDPA